MKYQEYQPHASLRNYVKCFWIRIHGVRVTSAVVIFSKVAVPNICVAG